MKPQDPIQVRAIQEAAKQVAKDLPDIRPGQYDGEVVCKIKYKLTKGEDYETIPTVSVLSKAVLAKAIVLSGIQDDNFFNALKKVMEQAFVENEKAADVMAEADARVLAKIEKMTTDVLAKLPKAGRAGACKVKADIEIIPPEGLLPA